DVCNSSASMSDRIKRQPSSSKMRAVSQAMAPAAPEMTAVRPEICRSMVVVTLSVHDAGFQANLGRAATTVNWLADALGKRFDGFRFALPILRRNATM